MNRQIANVLILVVIIIALLLPIPFMIACSCPARLKPSNWGASDSNLRERLKPQWYVAHAFGEIDGNFYTNSREAFLSNYERGFRIFEVDLVLLKDGSVFCAHDNTEWMYGLEKPFIETTAEELSGRLCLGKYTPLTGSELLDLIYEYKDAYFLLDTKRTVQGATHNILKALVSEAKSRCPAVLDRMIPHTFGPDDLRKVSEIYSFKDYWVAVYSHGHRTNGKSDLKSDQIVLYVLSNGGPLQLMRISKCFNSRVLSAGNCIADFSWPGYPAVGFLSPLGDIRVYISIDRAREWDHSNLS